MASLKSYYIGIGVGIVLNIIAILFSIITITLGESIGTRVLGIILLVVNVVWLISTIYEIRSKT